jgi:peroxiredoxin Q/BCP
MPVRSSGMTAVALPVMQRCARVYTAGLRRVTRYLAQTVLYFARRPHLSALAMQLIQWLTRAALLLALLVASAHAQVAVGDAAPDFRLQDQDGRWHTLAEHKGQWIVLYFYPKDQTPGCTKQACDIRDNFFAYEEAGALVLGVSLDDIESHDKFAEKYSLPFPLLADVDGVVAQRYDVLNSIGPIKLAKRETFLIDPAGKVVRHYPKVDPATHSADVLADLKALGAKKPG